MEKENWPTVTSITRFIEYLEFSKVLIVAFFFLFVSIRCAWFVVLFCFGSIFLGSTSMQHVTGLQKKKERKKLLSLHFLRN